LIEVSVRLTIMHPTTVNEIFPIQFKNKYTWFMAVRIKTRSYLSSRLVVDLDAVVKEKAIGSGSYGNVFKGTYYGAEVAIKDFTSIFQMDGNAFLATFKQEVLLLSTLHHKNIVKFIAGCTEPPNLMIVMEFAKKGSLYGLIQKPEAFPSNLTVKIALDIVRGMNYLHDHKVIHRDLKSPNVLITEDWTAQLCDFGCSRTVDSTITSGIGTPQWMAPELLSEGFQNYNEKVDVYSFGIILWELVAKEAPFKGLPSLQLAQMVKNGARPKIPDNSPQAFIQLMTQCWHQDPNRRPPFEDLNVSLTIFAKKSAEKSFDTNNKETEK